MSCSDLENDRRSTFEAAVNKIEKKADDASDVRPLTGRHAIITGGHIRASARQFLLSWRG